MDKPRVVLHVHWQAVIGNLTDDPGPTTSAHEHLWNRSETHASVKTRKDRKSVKMKCPNLLGHSAGLHSDVTTRVTNADDHHPLPVHVFRPLVVPAVKVFPLEGLNSFRIFKILGYPVVLLIVPCADLKAGLSGHLGNL